jgi:hypothetical protein
MAGTLGALHLIERTAAHLCHALASPVGQLNQALSSTQTAADAALSEAAKALSDQLNLRQIAWRPAEQPLPLHQVTALARGLPSHLAVDFSALPPATMFAAGAGRIVLNILLLAVESLPNGGRVILAGAAEDLFVQISGAEAAWPPGMALCLANEAEAQAALADGRNLQMAMTALLAHAAGIRLSPVHAPTLKTEPAILRLGG